VCAGVCYDVCCYHRMENLNLLRQKTLNLEHGHLIYSIITPRCSELGVETWKKHLTFIFLVSCWCVGCWCCNLTKAYVESENFFSVLHWEAVDIPDQTVLYSVQYNL